MTRVRAEGEAVDLEQFRVNHDTPEAREEVVGYSWDGLVMDNPGSPHCLCKRVKSADTGTPLYFVKFVLEGVNAGRMLDPHEEGDITRRGDWAAKGRYAFRPVTKLAFDYYLQFVKTGNRAYLRQAEREVDR